MATFSTKKILYGSTSLIPTIANRIQEEFQIETFIPEGKKRNQKLMLVQH